MIAGGRALGAARLPTFARAKWRIEPARLG